MTPGKYLVGLLVQNRRVFFLPRAVVFCQVGRTHAHAQVRVLVSSSRCRFMATQLVHGVRHRWVPLLWSLITETVRIGNIENLPEGDPDLVERQPQSRDGSPNPRPNPQPNPQPRPSESLPPTTDSCQLKKPLRAFLLFPLLSFSEVYSS